MARVYEIAFQLAGKISSSFGNAFASAESKLQKMNQQISSLKAEIKELERAQKTGKISAEEYAAAYAKLTAQLEKTEKAQKNLAKAVDLQQRVANFRDKMRSNMLGAIETAITIGAPVKAAIDFESVMADVRKVVDFETPEQLKAMEKDILALSSKIPMAASGIAEIVAAGGQAGIARDELIKFAESAAMMGVAFDITADEAGQMMAEWRSAFKMNQDQVITLADQINYLGNTTAASAPKISEVVRRIGPLGEVGGAAAAEIAALGATMVSAGITEEVAATGIKNLILGLVAGESATKTQAEAFKTLGLNAKDMAKMMKKDAQGAILKVLEALQKLPEYKQASVLKDLFGKESIGAIAPLLTNLDALKENFQKVADATQYAGSMQKEFEARAATTENSLILLKNRVAALGISLGNIMLPHVNYFSEKLSAAVTWVQNLSEKYPKLTAAIVLGTAGVLGFTVALTGLLYVASIIITPFVNFYAWAKRVELISKLNTAATRAWTAAKWAWNMAMSAGRALLSVGQLALYHAKTIAITAATKAWAAAQWLWNAAMNANPIGMLILGISALIGVGYLLIKNWDKVRNWFTELWNNPLAALQRFVDNIKEKFGGVLNWIEDKWNKLVSLFGGGRKKVAIEVSAPIRGALPAHAEGGIFTKPHIAWFAEEGPEAVVPLDGSPRALSIWARAGEALGVRPIAGGDIIYSPIYNIYGGGRDVEQQVRRAARAAEDDFAARFRAYRHQERRLSYA